MNKLTKFVIEVANFRFILKLLVIFGLASIAPFILVLNTLPADVRTTALVQTVAAYIALYLFFGHYIRINEPAPVPEPEEEKPE